MLKQNKDRVNFSQLPSFVFQEEKHEFNTGIILGRATHPHEDLMQCRRRNAPPHFSRASFLRSLAQLSQRKRFLLY